LLRAKLPLREGLGRFDPRCTRVIATDSRVFLHIPKTGGSFVQSLLREHLPVVDHKALLREHDSAQRIWTHASHAGLPRHWQSLPVFCVLRNPWDWYVSWVQYQLDRVPRRRRSMDAEWETALLEGQTTFKEVVLSLCRGKFAYPPAGAPERGVDLYSAWIGHIVGEAMDRPDFTALRFEALRQDLRSYLGAHGELTAELDRAIDTAPARKVSAHHHYSTYYDAELADFVGERTQWLCERFGYRFERAPAETSVPLGSREVKKHRRSGDDEHPVERSAAPTADPAPKVAKPLARWIESRNLGPLRRVLQSVGLEVFEHKPEHHYVDEYYGRSAEKLIPGTSDPDFFPLAQEIWLQKRTFLYYNRLYTLYQATRNVVRQFPTGQLRFLEAGVHRGGSARFIAEVAARHGGGRVALTAVDTFDGHAIEDLPDGEEGGHLPGSFRGPTVDEVRDYLRDLPFVDVVAGRIQDVGPTLRDDLHLVHVDVDIYAPTRYALELAHERLLPGGVVVVDDYGFTTCPGARQAVDEFVAAHAAGFILFALDSGQALVVRVR
jgi:O-methyltransferase